jgi:hypothetical protein
MSDQEAIEHDRLAAVLIAIRHELDACLNCGQRPDDTVRNIRRLVERRDSDVSCTRLFAI